LTELEKYADELGSLEKRLAPFVADIARVDVLRKAIRASYGDSAAATTHLVNGRLFTLAVGACSNASRVNAIELQNLIGSRLFAEIATATLKSIEEKCPAGTAARVVTTTQTGPRSLKTFERNAPNTDVKRAA
jgi:hypothetical protein